MAAQVSEMVLMVGVENDFKQLVIYCYEMIARGVGVVDIKRVDREEGTWSMTISDNVKYLGLVIFEKDHTRSGKLFPYEGVFTPSMPIPHHQKNYQSDICPVFVWTQNFMSMNCYVDRPMVFHDTWILDNPAASHFVVNVPHRLVPQLCSDFWESKLCYSERNRIWRAIKTELLGMIYH